MKCKRGQLINGLFASALSGLTIFGLRARILPDFLSYSHGGSCWSSATTCVVGHFFGSTGVETYSWVGATACGVILASPIAFLLVALSPIGQGINNAGADSVGAAFYSASPKKMAYFLLLAAIHLVCAFHIACVVVGGELRIPPKIASIMASIGAIIAMYVAARVRGIPFSGIQWRYILPSVVFILKRK